MIMGKSRIENLPNNFKAVAECSPAFVDLITDAYVTVTKAQTLVTEAEIKGARAA